MQVWDAGLEEVASCYAEGCILNSLHLAPACVIDFRGPDFCAVLEDAAD